MVPDERAEYPGHPVGNGGAEGERTGRDVFPSGLFLLARQCRQKKTNGNTRRTQRITLRHRKPEQGRRADRAEDGKHHGIKADASQCSE